jgi:hypothetical protein
MPDARTIIDGDPGDFWINETDRAWFQLHVTGNHTCGLCWQYNNKIARYWPLPLHGCCRCFQEAIKPGARAPKPFIDYEKTVAKLPPHEQNRVMGKGLYSLVRHKVIDWSEAVTPGRIRTLEEVVSRNKLSVERMTKAGVTPRVARTAYESVHTPEHEIVERHRRQQIADLVRLGMPDHPGSLASRLDTIVRQGAERLASRVGIAEGPSYTTRAGAVLPGIQQQSLAPPESVRAAQRAELAALLAGSFDPGALERAKKKARKKLQEQEERDDGDEQ